MYMFNNRDLLEEPEKYFYADCSCLNFVEDWLSSRNTYFEQLNTRKDNHSLPKTTDTQEIPDTINTENSLRNIYENLLLSDYEVPDLLLYFLRRFEITKKLFEIYNKENNKPLSKDSYRNINIYISFSECLSIAYKNTGNPQYLSTLNKVMDTMTSIDVNQFNGHQSSRLQSLITAEINYINEIRI